MTDGANRMPFGGLLIDRDRPVSFRFEGCAYQGFVGDTIASALAANDVWVLSRSFKYHRPRGIASMTGQDANGLVQLDGAPNIRAERRGIEEGLEVSAQNYAGSLARDRGALVERFARFMPVGFYYRAFFRPRGIWQRFWERAGSQGAPQASDRVRPRTRATGYHDKAYGFHATSPWWAPVQRAWSAALEAAERGAEVLLVDENEWLGGSLGLCPFRRADDAGAAEANTMRTEIDRRGRGRIRASR